MGALLDDRDLGVLDALIAEQEAVLLARTQRSHELHQAASAHLPSGVASSWQNAAALSRVPRSRRRVEGLGRRRHGVRRPAQRVRHDARRPRPSSDRRRGDRARGRRHALRPAGARHHPRGGRARPPLRTAAVAVRELRHRGDDDGGPPDACGHRARPHHQGRGQLPRPPRRGAGVRVPRADRRRTRRAAGGRARARRHPGRRRRADPCRPVRPPRCRSARAARPPRRDRRDDRRAGDDEHRRRPAAARLPRRARHAACTPTARCSRSTR